MCLSIQGHPQSVSLYSAGSVFMMLSPADDGFLYLAANFNSIRHTCIDPKTHYGVWLRGSTHLYL